MKANVLNMWENSVLYNNYRPQLRKHCSSRVLGNIFCSLSVYPGGSSYIVFFS